MSSAKFFWTLDISNEYNLHMSKDHERSLIQTISTQKGLYKVNRLMFGIKLAPAVWQRFIDKSYRAKMESSKSALQLLKENNLFETKFI